MKNVIMLRRNTESAAHVAEYLTEKNYAVLCITDDPVKILQYAIARQPDVLIADKYLGDESGLEAARYLKRKIQHIHSIIITPPNDFFVNHLFHYDVNAYLSPDHSLSELLLCLQTIKEGYRYLGKGLKELVSKYDGISDMNMHAFTLSVQEKKILRGIIAGKKSGEIAQGLNISINTLNNHKTNIRNKIGLKSNRELLFFALKNINGLDYYNHEQ